jgi:site-specific DNA-methyltransferase (adenine-specific)
MQANKIILEQYGQHLNYGCSIEAMKQMPDNCYDLAIVDPQTGQNEGKNHANRDKKVVQKNGSVLSVEVNHQVKSWDNEPPPQEYYDQLFRVTKHQIIMCENYLNFDQKSSSPGRIVWNMLRDVDFSDAHIMWTSLFNKIDYFEYLWNGMIQGTGIKTMPGVKNKYQRGQFNKGWGRI